MGGGGAGAKGALIGSTMDPVGGAFAGGALGHALGKGRGKSAQGPATPPPNINYHGFTPVKTASPTPPSMNWWGQGQPPQWSGQAATPSAPQGKQGANAQGPQTAMSQMSPTMSQMAPTAAQMSPTKG